MKLGKLTRTLFADPTIPPRRWNAWRCPACDTPGPTDEPCIFCGLVARYKAGDPVLPDYPYELSTGIGWEGRPYHFGPMIDCDTTVSGLARRFYIIPYYVVNPQVHRFRLYDRNYDPPMHITTHPTYTSAVTSIDFAYHAMADDKMRKDRLGPFSGDRQ